MRATKALMMAMLAGLGCAGCNPSSFNSILDKAPVASFTPPGSGTGSLFVLPLPLPSEAGTTSAARMLVTRNSSGYVGVADFDMNGKVTLTEASAAEASIGGSVYSAAMRADGMIIVGTPQVGTTDPRGGRVSTLSLTGTPAGGYTVQRGIEGNAGLPHLGISVAAGNVTGIATGNFVVVGDNTVQVLGADPKSAIATPSGCSAVQLGSTTGDLYAFRPVAVGDLLDGGFDEIVLGGQGKVTFVQYDAANTTDPLPCPKQSIALGSVASLAVDYFNNDPHPDLAVGAPPDKVYVFFGPLDGVTTPSVTITNSTATGFGQRIASYHVPGQAWAQLMVADPAGAAGGRSGAGRVMLFDVSGTVAGLTDASAIAILFDSNEDSETGVFGANLGGVMFNTQLCAPSAAIQLVPWATNNADVLTFFNYAPIVPPAPVDPRCFALKP
jgi:hypothetical protein